MALSLTISKPLLVPAAPGVNVTRITHVAPGARELPQLFACAKSPVVEIAEIANAVERWFVSVTALEALVVPTVCWPKLRLVGDIVTSVGSARQGSPKQLASKHKTRNWNISLRKRHLAATHNCRTKKAVIDQPSMSCAMLSWRFRFALMTLVPAHSVP